MAYLYKELRISPFSIARRGWALVRR
jgi:hypothetical protein